MIDFYYSKCHQYYLSCQGLNMKAKTFYTRQEANRAMYEFCDKNHIHVECVDDSKHCKMYSNNEGVSFCICRI